MCIIQWKKIIVVFIIITIIIMLLVWLMNFLRLPYGTLTRNCIGDVAELLQDYVEEHGQLPDSLECFRQYSKNYDVTKDEWGRPLIYNIDSGGFVVISSFGRDNKLGGKGANSDILFRFKINNMGKK
jgi:hypothetical protein